MYTFISSTDIVGTGLDTEYNGGEMVMFRCGNGLNVTIRTSGTEPKLKYYTELVADADTELWVTILFTARLLQGIICCFFSNFFGPFFFRAQEKVKVKLEAIVKEFIEELLQPEENGLLE